MRLKTDNISIPVQTAYGFCDGQLHSDPNALTAYYGAQNARATRKQEMGCLTRSYEKAQRLQRLVARAYKERQRRGEG